MPIECSCITPYLPLPRSYTMARLLGLSPDDPMAVAARAWIHARGGATHITSWGKFWLSVLGVYAWQGQNPLPPEMWLLPYKVPPAACFPINVDSNCISHYDSWPADRSLQIVARRSVCLVCAARVHCHGFD